MTPEETKQLLQVARDSSFFRLLVSTYVVGFGIVLEAPEVIHETWDAFKKWPISDNAARWIKALSCIGWVLIVVGVMCEGVFEADVSDKDGRLQAFQESRIGRLDQDVILAQNSAKSAYDSAVKAQGEAKDASGGAEAASKEATAAFRDAERAKEHEAQLDSENIALRQKSDELAKELNKEQQTRLELEKSLAPRNIPFVYMNGRSNVDSLHPFAGMKALIGFIRDDAEARRFAGQMATILKQAGWLVTQLEPLERDPQDGVKILSFAVHPNEISDGAKMAMESEGRSPKAADALADFLNNCNIQASSQTAVHGDVPFPEMMVRDPESVRVLIGMKPLPYFASDWEKQSAKELAALRDRIKTLEGAPTTAVDLPCSAAAILPPVAK